MTLRALRVGLTIVLAANGVQGQGAASGLQLTLIQGARQDARPARLLALAVPEGGRASPWLEPGPFEAVFVGSLRVDFRDRYTFTLEGNGQLGLRVDGEPVALGTPVRLAKGEHAVEARYHSPPAGIAQMRLLWAGSDFAAEPPAPNLWSHAPGDALLVSRTAQRRGRERLAEQRCVHCHAPPQPLVLAAEAMPELRGDAPLLSDVGSRLRRDWLAQWVADPAALRHDATMPQLLTTPEEANDVATFLASLGPLATELPMSAADAQAGGRLFAQLGCIACHARPDAAAEDLTRVGLRWVAAKWYPRALVEFLLDPTRHAPASRMPDFALQADEARQLAAFLLARSTAAVEPAPSGDPARGRELVRSRGCLNCHFLPELGAHRAPSWSALANDQRGCLAESAADRGRAPRLQLDPTQRADVRLALPEWTTLARDVPAEAAARAVVAWRCDACHALDGREASWSRHAREVEDLLVEAEPLTIAQLRPALTWAGEKLHTDWLQQLLRGEIRERPRPWLQARMPVFAASADVLARGLAHQHGLLVSSPPALVPDDRLVAVGRQLVGAEGGFACTLCHALGSKPATAVFEVQGINFSLSRARLRESYGMRWLRNPLRLEPMTRMPKYADDHGKTGLVDVLDGDAERQFAAIWQFLASEAAR